MKKTKIDISSIRFPEQIKPFFHNADVYNSSCHPDADVLYLSTGYYIKIGKASSLAAEAVLSRMFYKIGLGAEVITYCSADQDYLVTRSVNGEDLTHYLHDPQGLCSILAHALRLLHCQKTCDFPISAVFQQYLNIINGDYPSLRSSSIKGIERYSFKSKEEAWGIVQAGKDQLKADRLIHGDACLPNIIQNQGKFSSFIDFPLSGIGDKHIDLYWAVWSLEYNLQSSDYSELFLDLYGRDRFREDSLKTVAALEFFDV